MMNFELPRETAAGNPAAIDYPGPPKFLGQAERELVRDNKDMGWAWDGAAWHPQPLHQTIWIVVESQGVFAMPRAWAFESEQEAVEFRLKREPNNRRPGTCHPVLAIPLGNPHHSGFNEIDWRKYPAPQPKEQKKWS